MKSDTRNLIANYVGRGWVMAINLIATPLIIKLMGIESYGLIGFYTTLYGLINLLDFGISPTINRELAQYSVDETKRGRGRDLVHTLEIGYWVIGVLLGIGVYFGAPIIAQNWLQSSKLSIDTLVHSIRLMGFLIVLEWPITFYQGALLGLQKHVRLNVINITNGLLKFGGALVILTYVSPTIDAFFTWQLAISALLIIVLVLSVWRSLPQNKAKPVFDTLLLEKIWKFALSMNMISFIGLVIHQIDKVFVSHFFTLEVFGYYNLATMVSSGFTMLVSPIYLTYLPRFSALVAQKDDISLRRTYHQSSQLVSVAILPAVTTGVLFANKIIQLWTGDPVVADKTAPIAVVLLIGTALNALAGISYGIQVAHGWTRLAMYSNLISLPVIIGLLFMLNNLFGIIGIAFIWLIHNLLMLVITVPIMHRKILKGDFGIWLWKDTLTPLFVCIGCAGMMLLLKTEVIAFRDSVPVIIFFAIFIQCSVALSVTYTREKAIHFFLTLLNKTNYGK